MNITATVLLDDTALLILGAGAIPAAGAVRLDGDDIVGGFQSVAWDSHFLALLTVDRAALLSLRRAALVGEDGVSHPLPLIARLSLDPRELVAGLQAVPLAPLVDFLRGQPAAERVLPAVLAACAAPDGFVEVFGRVRGGTLFLQGWSQGLPAGAAALIVAGEDCRSADALVATYTRPDLSAPAHGFAAVVNGGLDPRDIRRLYIRRGDTYARLEVFENRLLWNDPETAAHVAALLPQLQADPAVRAALQAVAAPRFQGEETLPALPVPVRAALDLTTWVAGEGVFLAGWLLDPCDLVAAVHLGGTNGLRVRLDQEWTRCRRPDVSQGYAADPLFAGALRPHDDDHGFVAFAPCGEADPGALYLEFGLGDGAAAFVPLRPAPPSAAEVRRMLSCFDIHHPDLERIVARHVGPAVMAAGRTAPAAPRISGRTPFGSPGPVRLSVIVPVGPARADIDVTLARLAVEPSLDGIELIFAAAPAAAAAIGPQLQRQARFYGLSGRLVTGDAPDMYAAMALGAEAAAGALLLFLGGSVLPRQGGWIARLETLLAAVPRAAAISPTLLYEDLSIRFAGARAQGWAPPAGPAGLTAYAGYARHWLAGDAARADAAVPVHAIAGECCLIRRDAFQAVGGFSGDLVGPEFKGLDLSLKLRAARLACLWAPGIEMLAPDETCGEPEYWARTGALVDRWGFERKWSQLFTANKDAA